jgi:NAD(P)-dependent dehydrogenase (short-subunit alcohol dehydrogenase family)
MAKGLQRRIMSVTFDITGKIAVITGAGGVICSVLAKEMSAKGAKVALLDLFIDTAEKIADEIRATGGDAIAIKADVLNRASLLEAKEKVLQHFGSVDILVNGAGGNKAGATTSVDKTFFDLDLDALRWVFDLNVIGAVLTTQVFGEVFANNKQGLVINIASMASYLPLTNTVAYSSAKAAVANFTLPFDRTKQIPPNQQ